MQILQLPIFSELAQSKRILIAGAGGGFDMFSGLPLYFGLRAAGRDVFLGNLSFADLGPSCGRWLAPAVVEITADSRGWEHYFPELHLARWFRQRGEEVPIYGFALSGVGPLTEAYQTLADELELDAVVLVDGGTDSLMRGDEPGLGTPEEDVASIAAVHALEIPHKLLVCLGFGVDTYHGVCHTHFLEAVAELTRARAFLGAWSLTPDMPEVKLYREATIAVLKAMPEHPSIVSTSILSAVEGQFGDYHANPRTRGSTLFINALMALYWGFHLDPVAKRILYLDDLYSTHNYSDVSTVIRPFRETCTAKEWMTLPM